VSSPPSVLHPTQTRGEGQRGCSALRGRGSEGERCWGLLHPAWPESREEGAFGEERILPTCLGWCWSTLVALLRKPSRSSCVKSGVSVSPGAGEQSPEGGEGAGGKPG